MLKTIKYQSLTLCWAVIILVLCSMPGKSFNNSYGFLFEGFDKIVHLGLFFVLTVLIFNGFIKQSNTYRLKITTSILIGIISVAFGAAIELLQWQFFASRSGDWWDLFADTMGVAMAFFSFVMLKKILPFNHKT